MKTVGFVVLVCALALLAPVREAPADTLGLGIFSDRASLMLLSHPPDPIIPPNPIIPIALYQAAVGAPVNVISLDCTEELSPPDPILPVEYYASGTSDGGALWYLHISSLAPTGTCLPSPTGDTSCTPAGITQTPSEITLDHCGAGAVSTLPTLGRFITFIPPNPI